MSEHQEWALPKSIQIKPKALEFDLQPALDSLVFIHMEAFEDGLTANTLGTQRNGYGVVNTRVYLLCLDLTKLNNKVHT